MKKIAKLRLTESQLIQLKSHLYPGDGEESIAIVICGQAVTQNEMIFLGHDVMHFDRKEVESRSHSHITWKTNLLADKLAEIMDGSFAILKIHSHPSGYSRFSSTDDVSDRSLSETVYSWLGKDDAFMSAVLLPNDKIIARTCQNGRFKPVDDVLILGDRLQPKEKQLIDSQEHEKRTLQVLGSKTLSQLKNLRIGVVGCSGTGGLVIQQLLHYGVGSLTLVDPDMVEPKNLNRIVGATAQDAVNELPKVEVFERMANQLDMGTTVNPLQRNVADLESINALKCCDIIFSCVDNAFARQVVNRIGTYYLIPIIDVGVKIVIEQGGDISHISARADYVLPGESLMSRKVFSRQALAAASMQAQNPKEYKRQSGEGYLPGLPEEIPAVITPNSFAASMGVLELLNRLHGLRFGLDTEIVSLRFNLLDSYVEPNSRRGQDKSLQKVIGMGDQKPILGYSSL